MEIHGFQGRYRFLSNFWEVPNRIHAFGMEFNTVEHAYQASKATDRKEQRLIQMQPTPGAAMRVGRRVRHTRPDWDQVKLGVMKQYVLEKFRDNPELRKLLIDTGNAYLEETNTWGDKFWGVSGGVGANNLGKVLMTVRSIVDVH